VSEHALVPYAPALGLAVTAAAERAGDVLALRYRLHGELDTVALPARVPAQRRDGLWERTCFEAFVAVDGHHGYVEINLSPSTEWAAYAFDGYRTGMRPLMLPREPAVVVSREPDALLVTASVDLAALAAAASPWRIGLAAVVAAHSGAKSHWALRHAGAAPDFHAAASFIVRL
jgi:hypothetical protein